jgi:DNA polymerase-1
MPNAKKKLVLIDGHALAYRAYHALPVSLATSQGELTNAVYGFTSMLLNVLRDEQPDYIAVAFDVGRTFRHDSYPEY